MSSEQSSHVACGKAPSRTSDGSHFHWWENNLTLHFHSPVSHAAPASGWVAAHKSSTWPVPNAWPSEVPPPPAASRALARGTAEHRPRAALQLQETYLHKIIFCCICYFCRVTGLSKLCPQLKEMLEKATLGSQPLLSSWVHRDRVGHLLLK